MLELTIDSAVIDTGGTCVTVGIIDDGNVECDEDFTAAISTSDPAVTFTSGHYATITVTDDDCKFLCNNNEVINKITIIIGVVI